MKIILNKMIDRIEKLPKDSLGICKEIREMSKRDTFKDYFACYFIFDYIKVEAKFNESKIKWANWMIEVNGYEED